jgi:hypothetical protein
MVRSDASWCVLGLMDDASWVSGCCDVMRLDAS